MVEKPSTKAADSLSFSAFGPALLAGLTTAAAGLLFVFLFPTSPHGCERDQYFKFAGLWRCGGSAPLQTTVGPIVPWLMALLSGAAGTAYQAGRVLNVVAGAAIGSLVFHFAAVRARSITAGAVALLFCLSVPEFLHACTQACTDVPAALFMLAGLSLTLSACGADKGNRAASAAGAMGFCAVMTRHQSYPFLIGLFLMLPLCAAKKARAARSLSFAAGLFFPVVPYLALTTFAHADAEKALSLRTLFLRGLSLLDEELLTGYRLSLELIAGMMTPALWIGLATILAAAFTKAVGRNAFLPLLPVACYFLGVGWFPQERGSDLSRLFFIIPPILAVAAAIGLFKILNRVRDSGSKGKFATTVLFIVLLFVPWRIGAIAEGFWEGRMTEDGRRATAAANEFIARADARCSKIVTPSLDAATVLPVYRHVEWEGKHVSMEMLEKAFAAQPSESPPKFVMLTADPKINSLETDVPFGAGYRLSILFDLHGYRFYKVTEPPSP